MEDAWHANGLLYSQYAVALAAVALVERISSSAGVMGDGVMVMSVGEEGRCGAVQKAEEIRRPGRAWGTPDRLFSSAWLFRDVVIRSIKLPRRSEKIPKYVAKHARVRLGNRFWIFIYPRSASRRSLFSNSCAQTPFWLP